jgi:hypothetical protein
MQSLFKGPPSDAPSSSSLAAYSKMSQGGSTTSFSSMKALMHAHSDALPSSGLDFLAEIHIRRENTGSKAQKMTTKEHSMILEGARKERAMILEDALKIIDA